MTYKKERAMVDAHKNGIVAYRINGSGVEMVHVIRHVQN